MEKIDWAEDIAKGLYCETSMDKRDVPLITRALREAEARGMERAAKYKEALRLIAEFKNRTVIRSGDDFRQSEIAEAALAAKAGAE